MTPAIKKTAAVIEITGSHEECMYAQLLFLKQAGYHTIMICSSNLEKRVIEFDMADESVFFPFENESISNLPKLLQLRRLLIDRHVSLVAINSAHGKLIQNLVLLPYPKDIQFIGILHGINKLRGSFTQKLISTRIKKYLLLNDYLVDNLKRVQVPHEHLQFESYYPIFFPAFQYPPVLHKPEDQLWITVPGQVEYARRDYITLVNEFARLEEKPDVHFILLGSHQHAAGDGPDLQQRIQALHLERYFTFTGYAPNAPFHAYLQASDIIMPLIHPGNDGFEKYLIYQITGSYNLAFAHKKPLLMLQDFADYEDFKENALFYKLEDLHLRLQTLREDIAHITPQLYKSPKWTVAYQQKKYIDFIER